MTRLLIPSDRLVIGSDEYPGSSPQPPCANAAAGSSLAADRARPARHIGRDLQALRATELPLRRPTGHGPKRYLSVDQPGGRPRQGLRAQRYPLASRPIDPRLPQAARSSRRDLRDQYGTLATTRGSWIGRHGPGSRRFRLRQGGRHRRQHGCVLSFRRRPAVRSGGAR